MRYSQPSSSIRPVNTRCVLDPSSRRDAQWSDDPSGRSNVRGRDCSHCPSRSRGVIRCPTFSPSNSVGSTCRAYVDVIRSPRWLSGVAFMPGVFVSVSTIGICPAVRISFSRNFRAVVFVHGCFWHAHDCPMFRWPQTRQEFWQEKIGKNQERDRIALSRLRNQGWRVLTVWECALKGPKRRFLDHVLQRCENFILDKAHELEEISGTVEQS